MVPGLQPERTRRRELAVHLRYSHTDLIAACEKIPERFIDEIRVAGRAAIEQGCEVLVMGFTALGVFLADHGVRDIDGVPILDSQAAVIKAAEMMVDLRKLGVPKGAQRNVRALEGGHRDGAQMLSLEDVTVP